MNKYGVCVYVCQVIIWVERPTGQVVYTSIHRCLSGQVKVALETFSGLTSSSTQAICAT